eukprot:14938246-Alexandrium_andersonii.AAC.1
MRTSNTQNFFPRIRAPRKSGCLGQTHGKSVQNPCWNPCRIRARIRAAFRAHHEMHDLRVAGGGSHAMI